MEFQIPIGVKKKLKLLAYYQISGGCLGFLILVWATFSSGYFGEKQILLSAIPVALLGFSIFCGQKILKGHIIPALNLSIINQILQVLSFSVFGFAFTYASGLFFAVGFDYTNDFKFALHFGPSTFALGLNTDSNLILLEVNLVAVYVLWIITKLKSTIETGAALFNSMSQLDTNGNILPTQDEMYLEDRQKI